MTRFLFLLGITLSSMSDAHEVRPAYLEITSTDISHIHKASLRQPQIAGQFLGLILETNCEQTSIAIQLNNSSITENYELNCTESPLREIEIVGLERTMIDALARISISNQESEAVSTLLITGDQPKVELNAKDYRLPIYLLIGFEHLLYGYDHLLFLLMLMYLVRKPIDLVKIITVFTLAHSTTLALSVFEFIEISQTPIEAIIAGTIILLAHENLRTSKAPSIEPLISIVFAFGLLHGLGFAGALKEIGLPQSSQFNALLLFNVGLEIAQLTAVFFVLFVTQITNLKKNKLLFSTPIYFGGIIASYWFIKRSWLIIAPFFLA